MYSIANVPFIAMFVPAAALKDAFWIRTGVVFATTITRLFVHVDNWFVPM
jgi:hypothetical protein